MTTVPPPSTPPPISPEEQARIAEIDRSVSAGAAGVSALIGALTEPSWAVRRRVVAGLAGLGDVAVPALCETLRSGRDDEARVAAVVDALSASTGAVDQAMIDLSADAEPALLADAAQVLGRRRSSDGLPLLIQLAAHENDNVAVAALEALGRVGGRAAIDALVQSIRSGNFFRTFPAIDVLGRSGDPRAVPALTPLLDDPLYVLEAARALGRTADRSATAPLTGLLARASDAQARVAAQALHDLELAYAARYGTAGVIERLVRHSVPVGSVRRLAHAIVGASSAEQIAICWVLGAIGEQAAVAVLTSLLDAAPPVAAAAAAALHRVDTDTRAELIRALQEGDSKRRLAVLPALSAQYALAPAVAQCLTDPDPSVRTAACEALARIGNPSVVSTLFARLSDPHPGVVHAAIAAIQSLGSPETEALASKAAEAGDWKVRRAAIRIIGYFGYRSALDLLLRTFSEDNDRLREAAVEALPFLEDPRAIDVIFQAARHPEPGTRAAAMRALGQAERDVRAPSFLLKGLSDADAWVRYYACRSLGRLGWEPAAESVMSLLDDDAGQVRVAAVEALSHLGGAVALGALVDSARSRDPDLRRAALLGLGIRRAPEVLPIIIEAARDVDPATRLITVSALADYPQTEALTELGSLARDTDEAVKNAAIGFLAARTNLAATRLLSDLLAEGPSEQILQALSICSGERIVGILQALETASDELAPALTSALARMHHPHAVEALFEAAELDNQAARKAAFTTLGAVASPRALDRLKRACVADADPEVRRICALALAT